METKVNIDIEGLLKELKSVEVIQKIVAEKVKPYKLKVTHQGSNLFIEGNQTDVDKAAKAFGWKIK
jgi:hypothetical protein